MQVIDKIILVQPHISIWSGRKKLTPEDTGGFRPPEDLVNVGNKRLVPKKTLSPFDSLKKNLERTLDIYGFRLIGGYAIANENVNEVQEILEKAKAEFEDLRDKFLSNFSTFVREQIGNFPEWKDSIEKAAKEIEPVLHRKFYFDYTAYKIHPPADEGGNDEVNEKFVSDEYIWNQAFREVMDKAEDVLLKLAPRMSIRGNSLKPVKKLKKKLVNIDAVDRQLSGHAVRLIDIVLSEIEGKEIGNSPNREILFSLLYLISKLDREEFQKDLKKGYYAADLNYLVSQMGYDDDESGVKEEKEEGEEEEEEEETEFVFF